MKNENILNWILAMLFTTCFGIIYYLEVKAEKKKGIWKSHLPWKEFRILTVRSNNGASYCEFLLKCKEIQEPYVGLVVPSLKGLSC